MIPIIPEIIASFLDIFNISDKPTPRNIVSDIKNNNGIIEDYIINFDYGIVDDYTGHGIGMNVHEDPEVPNFTCTTRGAKLRHNMTLAIEPMITLGTHKIKVDKDGWTVRTQDGRNSAHYENTVLITENGPEILTL